MSGYLLRRVSSFDCHWCPNKREVLRLNVLTSSFSHVRGFDLYTVIYIVHMILSIVTLENTSLLIEINLGDIFRARHTSHYCLRWVEYVRCKFRRRSMQRRNNSAVSLAWEQNAVRSLSERFCEENGLIWYFIDVADEARYFGHWAFHISISGAPILECRYLLRQCIERSDLILIIEHSVLRSCMSQRSTL